MTPRLELRDISKRFGATQALDGVSLEAGSGEVHALIGENGAGKSTLMKVLSGAVKADSGSIRLDGEDVSIANPAAGRRLGIAMIYQELNLAPHLTVEENLTLGLEHSRFGFAVQQRAAVKEALERVGHADIPLTARADSLSIGQQQVVEIARALMSDAKVVIMDEPTSSLSAQDTHALFDAIRRLRDSGITVVYISHFLEEVLEIADRYTVLRDGRAVASGAIAETNMSAIISAMVGRELSEMFPVRDAALGDIVLSVEGLSGRRLPRDVSFSLCAGEVLGIAGLVGAGRTELLRCLFGLDPCVSGTVRLGDGERIECTGMTPRRALALGIDLLSENRKDEGLAVGMSVAANATLSRLSRFANFGGYGTVSLKREAEAVRGHIRDVGIRCEGPGQIVDRLSGGNQQKIAFARIVEQDAAVLLLDEPTRGVDVGSKIGIYTLINRLAESGKGVVFVSSYLPELLGVCDRIAVMHRGTLSEARPASEWTEHAIMEVAATGAMECVH